MIKLLVAEGLVDYNHLQLKGLLEAKKNTQIITISPELYKIIEGSIVLFPKEFSSQLVIYKDGKLLESCNDGLRECIAISPEVVHDFNFKLGIVDYDHILHCIINMLNDDSISLQKTKNYIRGNLKSKDFVVSKNENTPALPFIDDTCITETKLVEINSTEMDTLLIDEPSQVIDFLPISEPAVNVLPSDEQHTVIESLSTEEQEQITLIEPLPTDDLSMSEIRASIDDKPVNRITRKLMGLSI